MNRAVLVAIARHCEQLGRIPRSAETGSGRTTLLFCQLSDELVVFTKDSGNSITAVRASALFFPDHVTFVEGPTPKTLPAYGFEGKFQVVLIDGPHGYPFPDLDTSTSTLTCPRGTCSFSTTRESLDHPHACDTDGGAHVDLIDTVSDTAFLRRTDAPLIDPYEDGWWLQGYNRPSYQESLPPAGHTAFGRFFGQGVG